MARLPHSASTKEIFLWRLTHAVLWSVLMQVFFLWIYLCVLYIDLVHPIKWIKETFSLLTSFKTWLRLIPCGSILFLQGVCCGKEYISQQPTYITRFSFFIHLFSFQNIILCCLHMLSGGLTVWLYLSMLGGHYSSLIKSCNTQEQLCLVEGNLFLMLSGFWNGMYYFLKDHMFTQPIITFPPIQQSKFILVKSSLNQLFKKAMKDSSLPIFTFMTFYCVKGSVFRNIVCSVFGLVIEDELLDTLFYIKSVSIIFYTWVFSTLFLTTMYSMTLLFNVYLSERNYFPIDNFENSVTLTEALNEGPEILKKLAAQDLVEMAFKDKTRRSIVFSLSQPGGHPTNWKNLSGECLRIINSYCSDLNCIVGDTKFIDDPQMPPKISPSPREIASPRLRNLAYSPVDSKVKYVIQEKDSFSTILKNEIALILNALRKKPGISYFFGEMMELKLKWIVLNGQIVAYVAQGLSQLVAASLMEDRYGVVQDHLSSIITSLIHLKQALDRLTKSGMVNRKSLRQDVIVMQLLTELKSSVKRSIYKITITFGDYMKDIPLDQEIQLAIQPFINLREG